MISVRWKKVSQDFLANKKRTFLVILAIFLGVFGTGLILNCYAITQREMRVSYAQTNPASFIMRMDPIDDALISSLQDMPDIKFIEKRRMIRSRVQSKNGNWLNGFLYVIDDFNNLSVDTFNPVDGNCLPATGEILLEQEVFPITDLSIGDSVNVKIPLGENKPLKVVGSVHAPGLKPAWIENNAYGFITKDTLDLLGTPLEYGELRFVLSENALDKDHIREVAFSIRDWCESNGYLVDHVEVPTPGKHPNGDQMNTLLFLFQLFGVLSLILSGVLVVNMISSMLNGQIRQIAIMKAIGANSFQIAVMYYAIVLILGIIALIFAMPLAIISARIMVNTCADMLNFTVSSYSIPASSFLLQLGAGILVPILAASFPIIKGSKITINDALHDYGVNKQKVGKSLLSHLLLKLPIHNSILLTSIRNTFRRGARLILTIVTLTVGGAILIVAINVKSSLENTINNAMNCLNYDLQYTFSQNYPQEDVEEAIHNIPNIYKAECFSGAMASLIYDDGTESNFFQLIAPATNTESLNLPLIQGRWIEPTDTDAIVINHSFLNNNPNLKLGDKITLSTKGVKTDWTIVGIVKEVGSNDRAYVNHSYYQQLFNQPNQTRLLTIISTERNKEIESVIAQQVEQQLMDSNIDILYSRSISEVKLLFDNHLALIAGFLIVASVLIILVGVMGLISSTEINIMERMRELGVMRSIGASPKDVLHIVIYEGILISFISWIISVIISIPLTYSIGDTFGNIFLQTSLDNIISPLGIILWLVLIIIITIIVSSSVTQKALKLPVNEVLNYE